MSILEMLRRGWNDYQTKRRVEQARKEREREYLRMIRKESYIAEKARIQARKDFAHEEVARREMLRDPLGIERSRKFWTDVGFIPRTKRKRRGDVFDF